MPDKASAEIRFTDTKSASTLELLIPKGYTSKDLGRVTLGELISKFRPSGCGACLSGQHFIIREKFENVLPINIAIGAVEAGH